MTITWFPGTREELEEHRQRLHDNYQDLSQDERDLLVLIESFQRQTADGEWSRVLQSELHRVLAGQASVGKLLHRLVHTHNNAAGTRGTPMLRQLALDGHIEHSIEYRVLGMPHRADLHITALDNIRYAINSARDYGEPA